MLRRKYFSGAETIKKNVDLPMVLWWFPGKSQFKYSLVYSITSDISVSETYFVTVKLFFENPDENYIVLWTNPHLSSSWAA